MRTPKLTYQRPENGEQVTGGVSVTGLLGELNAIVRQNGVDAVGYGFQQVLEELPSCSPVSLVDELAPKMT
ncbi:MAG: transposase domain-containing protein [Sphingomonas sp.]|nr:transposase domain-containing protein [Sphingomonas sp.]